MSTDYRGATAYLGDPGALSGQRLVGKVAVVTGAGARPSTTENPIAGNGQATAIVLAREGARVALLDLEPEWVAATAAAIEREGGQAITVKADVTDESSVRAAIQRVVGELGSLSILVNNVGIVGPLGPAPDVDTDQFDRAMRVNLTSMVITAKQAIPVMAAAGGGTIVNLASVSGMLGGDPNLFYPISKTAVIGLTRSMAAHHGAAGIRVNCVAPGMLYTPMVASRGMTNEIREARRDGSILKTEGTAWDVAMAIAFLASDAARWITGITLPVDAGATAAREWALTPTVR
ncbi:MAG: SDR family oxidoreductase [Chloroflexota bacterium]